MQRESWDYGESAVVERNGVIRRLEPVPWMVTPRRRAWQQGVRLSRRWVWYPARTFGRLLSASLILSLALFGWAVMTWISLRLLSWLGVRP